MADDLLQRLTHAATDEERAAIVLEMSLAALPAELQTVVQAAAIPHWFDAQFLEALAGEAGDRYYDQLLTLSFVEQTPGRGYAIHERTRLPLLRALWRADPARFRSLSSRAAVYCAAQAGANGASAAAWQAEAVYHQLISDPEAGVTGLRGLATRWANYEYHTYDEIEATIRLAQEQLAAGRLSGAGAAWTRLWQARLALLYQRADLAAAPLEAIAAEGDLAGDPYLAAELAQTRGDLLAQQGDRAGMAAAWNTAYAHYRALPQDTGRLDAYLVAEKMREHGLPLPDAETTTDATPKIPPSTTALRLIENIQTAWIDGVLKPAVQQTIDLRLARDGGQPANLVFHRHLAMDRPLAAGQRLSRLFTAAGGSLLILGAPGSGKTITLLQLLDELLQEARADGRAPIPLLFNLSSFAAFAQEKGATFPDWLVEQAHTQYRLKRETTRAQLAANRFVLLLDGLDEVRNEAGQREQCIRALNEFMQQAACGLVVCSRITDYQILHNRLALAHALVLQPLGNRQIEAFIQQTDSPDSVAMQQRLANDWQLREALRSPLLLNLYFQAFPTLAADGEAGGTVAERRQALLAAYVTTVFDQPAPTEGHSKGGGSSEEQSMGWLAFLAGRMQQVGTTLFHVEELQPIWLPDKLIGRYRGLYGLFLGLSVGLIFGLIFGLFDGLIFGLIFGLIGMTGVSVATWLTTRLQQPWLRAGLGGLSVGLSVGLISELIVELSVGLSVGLFGWLGITFSAGISSLSTDIQLRERVKPVRPGWPRIKGYTRRGSFVGTIVGIIVGMSGGLIVWLRMGLIDGLIGGLIYGLIGGLIFGLIGGLIGLIMAFLDTPPVDKRPYPGSGPRASIRNAIAMTTLAALFFGLPTWLIDQAVDAQFVILSLVLINILPPTFTWFGGLAWCQHWALRFMLARRGWLPWRLLPWLEEMRARGLLRRVGGGYIFIHRSLLEYFAALDKEKG